MRSMDQEYWDFDNVWIKRVQRLSILTNYDRSKGKIMKLLSWIFRIIQVISFPALDPNSLVILINIAQIFFFEDIFCAHMMLLLLQTVFISQLFKRCFFRKRPVQCTPHRAYVYNRMERNSSFVSQTILIGVGISWALCISREVSYAIAALICLAVWSFLSFLKVVAGSIYPSDCFATLPVCAANIGIYHLTRYILKLDFLPNTSTKDVNPITIDNIKDLNLHTLDVFKVTYFIPFFIFLILVSMIHPITLWKKTPVWMGSALSMLVLHVVLLNPQPSNNFMMAVRPQHGEKYSPAVLWYAVVSLTLILFLLVGIADQLLGRRVGQVMAFLQRILFFVVMLVFNSMLLILTRMNVSSVGK